MVATAVRTVTLISSYTVRSANVKTKNTIRHGSATQSAVRKNTRAINTATTTTTAADVAGTVVTAVVTMATSANLNTATNANV